MKFSAPTLVGFIAILLWSCLALFTAATGTLPPFELTAITFGISGVCGSLYALLTGKLSVMRQPWKVWALGVGGLFGYHAAYFAALRLAPPAEAGLVAYLWPLLIVLFSALLPEEKLRWQHLVGAILGFSGVITLFLGKGNTLSLSGTSVKGYALALLCAFIWSGYSVLSRAVKQVPTLAVAGYCLVTAALALVASALFETMQPIHLDMQLLAATALGLGPLGFGFFAWDYGVKHGDIKLLGIAAFAAPVLSTLILVATGYAAASWALALACALIVGGALVATRQSQT